MLHVNIAIAKKQTIGKPT